MNISKPNLPREPLSLAGDFLSLAHEACEARSGLEELHIKGVSATKEALFGLQLSCCIMESCQFLSGAFKRGSFSDVVFRSCDFSGSNFSDSRFSRCEFVGCKGMGAIFAACYFHDVSFANCNFHMASLTGSRMFFIEFDNTNLSEADISSCELKNIDFHEVKLRAASLFHTPLKGIDLSGCDIEGIGVTAESKELKGAVLDAWQASELAALLGVRLK